VLRKKQQTSATTLTVSEGKKEKSCLQSIVASESNIVSPIFQVFWKALLGVHFIWGCFEKSILEAIICVPKNIF